MCRFNKSKFKNILHYIIQKCGNIDNIGKTVIWKILYFCDFDFYELYETSITGEKYVKLQRGPAPSHFDGVVDELKSEHSIKEINAKYCGFKQIKFLSLKDPNLSGLSGEELKLIDNTISKLSSMTATQVSSYSHQDMPWQATEFNNSIDYELVFYRDDTMSVREYKDDCVQR